MNMPSFLKILFQPQHVTAKRIIKEIDETILSIHRKNYKMGLSLSNKISQEIIVKLLNIQTSLSSLMFSDFITPESKKEILETFKEIDNLYREKSE